MGTLDQFQNNTCPRCTLGYLFPVGDEHYVRLPIQGTVPVVETLGIDCYVKVCKNCAYVDLYAKLLVDGFRVEQRPDGSIAGRISVAGGQHLLSVYVTYRDPSESASDFTVPITPEQWFQLRIALDSLSDEQLIKTIYTEPYQRAWRERVVEPFPPSNLAMHVRQLIRDYKD